MLHDQPAFGSALLGQASAPPSTGQPAAPAQTAQPGAPQGGAQGGAGTASPGMGNGFFLILLLFMLAVFLPTIFAGRKQKKQRAQMLSSLGKHDRIQTVGGIIGDIVEVRETEILLRVDDNTRIRLAKSAVQTVLRKSGGGGTQSPAEPALQTTP